MTKLCNLVLSIVVLLIFVPAAPAQVGVSVAEPFKLGTFEIDGEQEVGIVLRDSIVVELEAANRVLERLVGVVSLPIPNEMRALIGQWEYGAARRVYEIVNSVVDGNQLSNRPDYIHDVSNLRTLAPILLPRKNAQRRQQLLRPRG